jgi:D-alanine-D-alanine ligase-like ATP-grasp enzyme
MEPDIEFNSAAFKHGVTEADIRHALLRPEYEELMIGYDNKYLVIGFDTEAKALEIMYNVIDEYTINVFHAMKCRNTFIKLLDL